MAYTWDPDWANGAPPLWRFPDEAWCAGGFAHLWVSWPQGPFPWGVVIPPTLVTFTGGKGEKGIPGQRNWGAEHDFWAKECSSRGEKDMETNSVLESWREPGPDNALVCYSSIRILIYHICTYLLTKQPTSRNLLWRCTSNSTEYARTRLLTTELFVIVKYWKQPKCPCIGEWLNKLCHAHKME